MTDRVSKTQAAFMVAVDAAGDAGHQSPDGGSRAAAVACSAWHRTARSLVARGVVVVTNNGSTYRARRVRGEG